MADVVDTELNAETVAAQEPAKRTRGPNRKKITTDVAATATETPVKKTRAKRGEKAAAAQLDKVANSAKVARATRAALAQKAVVSKPTSPADDASDSFADLLSLEEENNRLRKELGERLRAENADLKRKLGKN